MRTAPPRVPLHAEEQENDGESSGLIDGISTVQNTTGEASTSGKSETISCQLRKTENFKHQKTLGLFAANFFDEKISLSKKLQWLNQVATVKTDGTVQLEVPLDIKPHNLDFEPEFPSIGPTNEDPSAADIEDLPPLQIVMLIVGTRGDIQPFVAIGKRLQEHGHRVRLATHSNFREFVLTAGLEFYPLGGDPKVLAWYMVKNKGILPSGPSEIQIQRNELKNIILSLLPACIDPDPNSNMPFEADAIIANPPACGHIHVAEALKIPLHIFFTMPWTFLHSADWGPKIDVVGFCFLDLASSYEPPDSLVKWLEEGEKPIYIGFGSLPVQEPQRMTDIIIKALETTGQRGIISKGWGGLGNLAEPKEYVYLLDNCPHDWLFARCSAVVHHGGAGTTAAGLRAACPTTIIPFFGDQTFWGEQVYARGVGPAPIPVDDFSLEKLIAAIRFMLDPKVKERAMDLATAMENEDGVGRAVNSFYKHFPRRNTGSECESLPGTSSFLSIRRCFGCS
ncbi:sterol 3-beta-glucosyltransferase UGT80A2 isoform X6 [Eucalyptus grandis]|uniref:sterol 3-beta-glucosyltransferase UGT80A2 isoform X6 n=1 Tax=Eucalyptus grandis TaxID=71139 RepID=UPI00192EEB33|nr:sterol 3-beta-glucosyltransferase UGT80A2 isoform X6 [Eucalyptus grandis]